MWEYHTGSNGNEPPARLHRCVEVVGANFPGCSETVSENIERLAIARFAFFVEPVLVLADPERKRPGNRFESSVYARKRLYEPVFLDTRQQLAIDSDKDHTQ